MKKYVILILVFLLCGCGKKEVNDSCKLDLNNEFENYSVSSNYDIKSKETFVTQVVKVETYKSKDMNVINYLSEAKEIEYKAFNDLYGGVTAEITKDRYEFTITTIIDFNKVDVKKLIDNNYINEDYTVNNKVSVGGIKEFYSERGAVCNE